MKRLFSLATLLAVAVLPGAEPAVKPVESAAVPAGVLAEPAGASALWKQYCAERAAGGETFLPDFSYAGYRNGEAAIAPKNGRVFNAADYGALPDDDKDDMAAIQKAIDAAAAAGGGVVFLPRGRYLLNSDRNNIGFLEISASGIVLRGEGAGEGGTVLWQVHPFRNGKMDDLTRLHLKQAVLMIRSPEASRKLSEQPSLATVTGRGARGGFTLEVDDVSRLKAGDNVLLYALNKSIIEEMTLPYEIEPEWTTTTLNRAPTIEMHRVAGVDGNKVTFTEPMRYAVRPDQGWKLLAAPLISDVGIEDIAFIGNAYAPYYHHRSDRDDVGWSFLRFRGVTDSWVRRCSFQNGSQIAYVGLSSYVSLLNLIVDGNGGHHIPRSVYFNYGMLGGFIRDRAGFTHGPSVSWGSVGTVFWNCESAGSIDSHAGRPLATLFDNVSGGTIHSSGGLRDYPQHLRDLVIWNFRNTSLKKDSYDFWKRGVSNRFVKPVIAGFHGAPADFNLDTVGVMESYGTPVEPASLYEAQLAQRLGKLPEWVDEVKKTDREMSAMKLPDPRACRHIETFEPLPLLQDLCEVSLRMHNPVPFELAPPASPLPEVTGDQVMLSHAVYMLMNTISREHTQTGNRISAEPAERNGVPGLRITLTSGPFGKAVNLASGGWFPAAEEYAAQLGGAIAVPEREGKLRIELWIPLRPASK